VPAPRAERRRAGITTATATCSATWCAGAESTEVEEGGFFHVPAGLVHRDVNPSDELQEIILSVVGEGPLVVNLDGPAS
jgi:quercetin dioxygenase-like cupin family protein